MARKTPVKLPKLRLVVHSQNKSEVSVGRIGMKKSIWKEDLQFWGLGFLIWKLLFGGSEIVYAFRAWANNMQRIWTSDFWLNRMSL